MGSDTMIPITKDWRFGGAFYLVAIVSFGLILFLSLFVTFIIYGSIPFLLVIFGILPVFLMIVLMSMYYHCTKKMWYKSYSITPVAMITHTEKILGNIKYSKSSEKNDLKREPLIFEEIFILEDMNLEIRIFSQTGDYTTVFIGPVTQQNEQEIEKFKKGFDEISTKT